MKELLQQPADKTLWSLRIQGDEEFNAHLAWVDSAEYSRLAACSQLFLHPAEQARYVALRLPSRKSSYLLGRYAGKCALVAQTGESATVFDIRSGWLEQPLVAGAHHEPLGISISHNANGACALAFPESCPMGIDIEALNEKRASVMRTQITATEWRLLADWQESDIAKCTVLWTAKEALSKVLRCGLTCPFELLAIASIRRQSSGWQGEFANFAQYQFRSWRWSNCIVSLVLPLRLEIKAIL